MMKHAFLVGAAGYSALEMLYRGRTHYSMALAGGCAMIVADRLRRQRISPVARALLFGAAVTGIEAICGCIWNRRYRVWDYRRAPMNWRGQICLPYSLLWCGMGAAVMGLMNHAEKSGAG
ncbi:MAG: hypothetical protein PUC00_04440 [Clostridiales bacterium]|nr:hypothetical protein [Clostridiales bacterium]